MSSAECPIPDAWPPPEVLRGRAAPHAPVTPLFPLPNLFLFPGTLMPLHIFEPRYCQMIEDSLDGPGRIVIGAVLEGWHNRLEGSPPVHPIAGLGQISGHERLPDGRFVIWLAGLSRARIREVASDRLYRRVEALPLCEQPVPACHQPSLRTRLNEAVLARTSEHVSLPDDIPLGHLTDLLLLRLQLPQSSMQDLYSQLAVADRAERALREHARRPLPPRRPPGGDQG